MALFRKIIEWEDDSSTQVAYKVGIPGKDINNKSRLIVRPSQAAVFVHKGKVADVFEEGSYDLGTQIFPIISKLQGWKYAFQTPITADIYYVNTKQFTNIKWGTSNPISMRDPEIGLVRVRAFGTYAFQVSNPSVFLESMLGTRKSFAVSDVADYLKSIIISSITESIGESKVSIFDLAGNTMALQEFSERKVKDDFDKMGLELANLVIENMSAPKEVEEAIDQRSKLGLMADKTDVYAKLAAADALKEAAKNPNGGGAGFMGVGIGMGAGVGMGQMMGETLKSSMAADTSPSGGSVCAKCSAKIPAGAKFCPSCGAKAAAEGGFCPSCGKKTSGGKFCPHCGAKI